MYTQPAYVAPPGYGALSPLAYYPPPHLHLNLKHNKNLWSSILQIMEDQEMALPALLAQKIQETSQEGL